MGLYWTSLDVTGRVKGEWVNGWGLPMRKYLAVKLKQARKFINAIEENVTDQHQQVGDRTVQE